MSKDYKKNESYESNKTNEKIKNHENYQLNKKIEGYESYKTNEEIRNYENYQINEEIEKYEDCKKYKEQESSIMEESRATCKANKKLEKKHINIKNFLVSSKLKMTELPEMERPYEKLKMFGAEKLSNAELLAIIIKTGTKNETALDLANKVIKLSNTLEELRNLSMKDLMQIDGIGNVKAIEIMAVCELTKRMAYNNNSVKIQIKSPKDVYKIFSNELMYKKSEIIKAIVLNTKNIIVKIQDVAVGDVNCSHVTMKMVLSENIRLQEPKLILVHNHPSGNSQPSESDIKLTKKLYEASKLLGIDLLDHIVIGKGNYKSIFSICKFDEKV